MANELGPLAASAAIIRLSTAIGERVLAVRAASGLSPRQLQVLRLAVDGVRMNALSDRLDAPKSTITSIVDQLEQAGLASRSFDETDRRGQIVTSTASGTAVLVEFDRALAHRVDEVLAGLNRAQARRLRALLAKLPDAIEPVPLSGPR
jgi:DNA-binding MarR family transcriptional regulator